MSRWMTTALAFVCAAAPASGRSPPPTGEAVTDAQLEHWLADSDVIFEGTVTQPGGSTVPNMTTEDHRAIVSIRTLYAPSSGPLVGLAEVTLFGRAAPFQTGEHAIFAAQSAIIGKGVALRYAGQLARIPTDLARLIDAAKARVADHALAARLTGAPLVVLGTVTAVSAGPAPTSISEHNPVWNVATVEVEATLKGEAPRQVEVLFPTSRDLRWYARRRFKLGDRGVFVLQRAPTGLGARYTALDALDFQPPDRADALRAQITTTVPTGSPPAGDPSR
jgi:hypothetical protein